MIQKQTYEGIIRSYTRTNKFKEEVNFIYKEENKKRDKFEIAEELKKKINVHGYKLPTIDQLVLFRILLLPYFIFRWLKQRIEWYVKFTIKKQEFSEEYKEHLTKTIL